MTIIVISPHLDDAALSCGQTLAAADPTSMIVTVGAALPEVTLTSYDRACGFESSQEAVLSRQREDERACSVLDVRLRHLAVLDGQYAPMIRDHIAARLLSGPLASFEGPVLIPLGLGHPDHRIVSAAALDAVGDREAWFYEELPYRVVDPEEVTTRVSWLRAHGRHCGDVEVPPWPVGDRRIKRAAVECYWSQRLEWVDCVYAPERFRRASPVA